MTDRAHYLHRIIWDALQRHHGAKNAITAHELTYKLGERSERDVRVAIKCLIEVESKPILSSTQKPYGFFIAASQEEVSRYKNTLQSRIRSTAQRLRGVDRAGTREFMGELQGELFGG